ncbi:hypothetical protein [Saccharopolyspora taberi]
MTDATERLEAQGVVGEDELRAGTRVRLRPHQRADIVDLMLADRTAEVDRVEEGTDGRRYVVVVLDYDPARDLGPMCRIGRRFFFEPEELEPLRPTGAVSGGRILVASVGDAFRVDGVFGRAVVERLRQGGCPPGVHLAEFGIRTLDLEQALPCYDKAILLQVAACGNRPGGLSVRETDLGRMVGERLDITVTCEPAAHGVHGELSPPAAVAVDHAVRLVQSLVTDLLSWHGDAVGS